MAKISRLIPLIVAVIALTGYLAYREFVPRITTNTEGLRIWAFPNPDSGETDDALNAIFTTLVADTTYIQPEDQWSDAPNNTLENDTYAVEIRPRGGHDVVWVNGTDTHWEFEKIFRNRCCAEFAPFPTLTDDGRFIFTNYTLYSAELVELDLQTLDDDTAIPSGWQTVDTGKFTVALPPGWTYTPQMGIDSFVGQFSGDGVTLSFGYGWYSGIPEYAEAANVTITDETIDGYAAQLVVPNVVGTDTVGVYFSDLGGSGAMTDTLSITANPTTEAEQNTVVDIFRSLQFATSQ